MAASARWNVASTARTRAVSQSRASSASESATVQDAPPDAASDAAYDDFAPRPRCSASFAAPRRLVSSRPTSTADGQSVALK